MTGRTHDLAAAVALLVIVLAFPPAHLSIATIIVGLLANQIGGIAPDIDEPTAPLWRNLPIGGIIGRGFTRLLGGHRFLTHSILGAALMSGLAWFLLGLVTTIISTLDRPLTWAAFVIGLISHLIMDTLTKEGVPWLLPVPVKFGLPPWRQLRITTGKAVETFLVFPALALFGLWYGLTRQSELLAILHRSVH